MASKLCMNCFAGYRPEVDGSFCPECSWDNSKPQVTEGLRFQTVLASRYVIGSFIPGPWLPAGRISLLPRGKRTRLCLTNMLTSF